MARKNDVLLIAAAGNFGENIDMEGLEYFPASYINENIISVINHGPKYNLHKTSNFGIKNADLSAPGTRILGAIPNNRLGNLTGTSQATAFVTGTAALIKGINKKLTFSSIKRIILSTTTKVTTLKAKCLTSGALNISKAIKSVKEMTNREVASSNK